MDNTKEANLFELIDSIETLKEMIEKKLAEEENK